MTHKPGGKTRLPGGGSWQAAIEIDGRTRWCPHTHRTIEDADECARRWRRWYETKFREYGGAHDPWDDPDEFTATPPPPDESPSKSVRALPTAIESDRRRH